MTHEFEADLRPYHHSRPNVEGPWLGQKFSGRWVDWFCEEMQWKRKICRILLRLTDALQIQSSSGSVHAPNVWDTNGQSMTGEKEEKNTSKSNLAIDSWDDWKKQLTLYVAQLLDNTTGNVTFSLVCYVLVMKRCWCLNETKNKCRQITVVTTVLSRLQVKETALHSSSWFFFCKPL